MPPRASLRPRAATPARSTRASTAAAQDTPTTRRSTRATSRQPAASIVANPALPEIHTQQSYAYGSSKIPALPEQLHARDMSMRAVANRLDDAANEAERNFQAHAAEVRGNTPDSQTSARDVRVQRRTSQAPTRRPPDSRPPAETPDDVRKQNRVAAWVDSSQLDDISEEDSGQQSLVQPPKTPAEGREHSVASSFPTGSFDHSYNYERGEREPRLPQPHEDEQSEPRRPRAPPPPPQQHRHAGRQASIIRPQAPQLLARTRSKLRHISNNTTQFVGRVAIAIWSWISRMIQTFQKSIFEIPDSPAVSALSKTIVMVTMLSLCSWLACTIFTYTCDDSSTSVVVKSLQSICGQCSSSSAATLPSWNMTGTDPNDVRSLLQALKHTQSYLTQIETRLNSRIDSSHASHTADSLALKAQQEALHQQIRRLSERESSSRASNSGTGGVASPLFDKINFFSPVSGAVVDPYMTSPTRIAEYSFTRWWAIRALGLRYKLSPPPMKALEAWLDEGDCWCAAETPSNPASNNQRHEDKNTAQDSVHLTIVTGQQIYPTELVVEHSPATGSLNPGTAPRDIELWADFSHVTYEERQRLHMQDLVQESSTTNFTPRGPLIQGRIPTWARIGTATYTLTNPTDDEEDLIWEMNAAEAATFSPGKRGRPARSEQLSTAVGPHVQRFNLAINQNGLLHYSDRFMLRVKNNHGANYTCLYRVRLHGRTMEQGAKVMGQE